MEVPRYDFNPRFEVCADGDYMRFDDHAAEVARLVMVLRALRDARHISSFVGAQVIANAVLADYPEVKA
jgi:hypothetical protein